jgi:hypothetical protein
VLVPGNPTYRELREAMPKVAEWIIMTNLWDFRFICAGRTVAKTEIYVQREHTCQVLFTPPNKPDQHALATLFVEGL